MRFTTLERACMAPPLKVATLFEKTQEVREAWEETSPMPPPRLAALYNRSRSERTSGVMDVSGEARAPPVAEGAVQFEKVMFCRVVRVKPRESGEFG